MKPPRCDDQTRNKLAAADDGLDRRTPIAGAPQPRPACTPAELGADLQLGVTECAEFLADRWANSLVRQARLIE